MAKGMRHTIACVVMMVGLSTTLIGAVMRGMQERWFEFGIYLFCANIGATVFLVICLHYSIAKRITDPGARIGDRMLSTKDDEGDVDNG